MPQRFTLEDMAGGTVGGKNKIKYLCSKLLMCYSVAYLENKLSKLVIIYASLMSLGCIYDDWTNPETGEIIQTFSIITTPANELLEVVHNRKKRMPLILPADKEKDWLSPLLSNDEIKSLIKPLDHHKLNAHTVSRQLNYSRNERNIPAAIRPVRYAELPEVYT